MLSLLSHFLDPHFRLFLQAEADRRKRDNEDMDQVRALCLEPYYLHLILLYVSTKVYSVFSFKTPEMYFWRLQGDTAQGDARKRKKGSEDLHPSCFVVRLILFFVGLIGG